MPTSDSFCMDRLGLWLYYSNNSCSYSYLFIYFVYLGGEPHHSFLCLGIISSVYVSLCVCFHFILFSLCMFLSILGFGDFFFLFCVVWTFLNVYVLPLMCFTIFITFYLDLLYLFSLPLLCLFFLPISFFFPCSMFLAPFPYIFPIYLL